MVLPASSLRRFLNLGLALIVTLAVAGIGYRYRGELRIREPRYVTPVYAGGLTTSADAATLRSYLLAAAETRDTGAYAGTSFGLKRSLTPSLGTLEMDSAANSVTSEAATSVSGTNIQVAGVDEPDTVKTDGRMLYLGSSYDVSLLRATSPSIAPDAAVSTVEERASSGGGSSASSTGVDLVAPSQPKPEIYPYPIPTPTTRSLTAFPPSAIAQQETIPANGSLLLADGTLLILGDTGVSAYTGMSSGKATLAWKYEYANGTSYADARLIGSDLILLTRSTLSQDLPCPAPLLEKGSASNGGSTATVALSCAQIYHPEIPVPVDFAFSAIRLAARTGVVTAQVGFLGSVSANVFSVSPNAIYVASYVPVNYAEVTVAVYRAAISLYPEAQQKAIERVLGYELAPTSKAQEISEITQAYLERLPTAEIEAFSDQFNELQEAYYTREARNLDRTEIAKIDLASFAITANTAIPGQVLNQFCLDEHAGYLRVATTVGGTRGWFGTASEGSENDVYVLDSDLKSAGSVQGLGLGERIYAARFVGSVGYLVTFRQTDPFYVLDLSDPRNPRVQGQLKIPGYSSYLHPLDGTLVLGVGRGDTGVKLTLFDVADPANPIEKATLALNAYWSEVESTHHAFLYDPRHALVFLPAGGSGHVVSVAGGSLSLQKTVAVDAQRAVTLDNYLYLISSQSITVLSEPGIEIVREYTLPAS